MKDLLGDRIKNFYEDRYKTYLTRRAYTIIRLDGKAFHTYTKGLIRPFDNNLIEDMNELACLLCKNIQNAKFAYVQSDEISILLTDFDEFTTNLWFDGNIQKITSISASMATAYFNQIRSKRGIEKLAMFDSRVFQIPSKTEVENNFIWRQQDAIRNSIQSMAQSLFSQKELNGKNTTVLKDMIKEKGLSWEELDYRKKMGTLIYKTEEKNGDILRTRWKPIETPIFTLDRDFLTYKIPFLD